MNALARLLAGGRPHAQSASSEPPGVTRLPAASGTHVTIRGLNKSFGEVPLYRDLDLDVPRGKIISVFGPNGCGKSTLINMIAGLLPVDGGEILFDGKTLRDTAIGYVFQNYREALLPWLTARRNIEYPLLRQGMKAERVKARVDDLIDAFDVRFDLSRHPYEFSGGQQQLVSIMRALAPRPEVLFLDEPFSALDYEMTLFIRDKLQEVQQHDHTTTLIVSHDLEDAVFLADRILLLTRRPTRVAAALDFDLPRPRGPESIADVRFVDVKSKALEIFRRELAAG